jgi:hypothetical protein
MGGAVILRPIVCPFVRVRHGVQQCGLLTQSCWPPCRPASGSHASPPVRRWFPSASRRSDLPHTRAHAHTRTPHALCSVNWYDHCRHDERCHCMQVARAVVGPAAAAVAVAMAAASAPAVAAEAPPAEDGAIAAANAEQRAKTFDIGLLPVRPALPSMGRGGVRIRAPLSENPRTPPVVGSAVGGGTGAPSPGPSTRAP